MSRVNPIIAIDGPAGSGKSTAARGIAKRYKFKHIDTGALYRAVALCAVREKADLNEEEEVIRSIENAKIEFRTVDGESHLYLGEEDISKKIRTEEISTASSKVSSYKKVRDALLALQRSYGKKGGCVLEGRDIATVIFPDAEIKIFLTASLEKRAQRRTMEVNKDGREFKKIMAQIVERDERDSKRDIAPLKKAEDAVEIDTTDLKPGEVLDKIGLQVETCLKQQKR